jgi:hypothetical protein
VLLKAKHDGFNTVQTYYFWNAHVPKLGAGPAAYAEDGWRNLTACPGPPGRLSALSIFLCKSVFYGAFVWARRALKLQKRRFLARAVIEKCAAADMFVDLRIGPVSWAQ